MKTINKKAFTIVELVIVISIIGILAAVLIPTFGNLIEKANEANDTSFVKNMNTMLIVEEVESGKPTTYTQMKDVLAENGINIEKIKDTNTKNYKYAWNYSTNRMILMDDSFNIVEPSGEKGTITNKHDYYVIVSSEEEINKCDGFGYYLADGFTGKNLKVKSGIDTGSNEGLTITVESEETFTAFVNTNKGVKLTIDAANATINHFGSVTEVEIIKVDSASYHEFGSVDFATIKAGRIEVMTGGKVSGLKATGSSKVDMQDGATIGAIEAEGSVTLDDKASGNKLSEEESNFAKMFKRPNGKPFNGYGTEKSPFIIASMDDWKDMINGSKGVYSDTNTSEIKWIDEKIISTSTYTYKWESKSYKKIFGHWKITCDLDFTNETEILGIEALYGTIDFDGHTVKGFKKSNSYEENVISVNEKENIKGGLVNILIGTSYQPHITIENYATKDFNVKYTGDKVDFEGCIKNLIFENVTDECGYSTVCTTISGGTIENVKTYGFIESSDNNAAPFAYNINKSNARFKNCVNYTNVTGNGGMVSAFVGKIDVSNAMVYFENCENYGSILNLGASENNFASVLLSSYLNLESAKLILNNCKNYGNIISVLQGNANFVNGKSTLDGIENSVAANGQKGQCISVGVINVLENQNGNYILNDVSDAVKYEISFEFTYKGERPIHGTSAYVANVKPIDTIKAYDWINYNEGMTLSEEQVGDLALYTTEINGITYYVFKYEFGGKPCTTDYIKIQYTAIGANDNPIAVYTTTVNCK